MSEYLIRLRVKHEPEEGPNSNELQILRDRIKGWCDEFCLEKQELTVE